MYSEIGFIFSPALDSYNNNDNTGNIYQRPIRIQPSTPNTNTSQGQTTPTSGAGGTQNPAGSNDPNRTSASEDGVLVYKNPNQYVGTTGIINYLKKVTYNNDDSNEDPYITLIRYFNKPATKALTLRAADFAYLKDLGVYPINRLWILRRFPDNCIVPNNLLAWGNAVQPISTVIGWMKNSEDNPMLSVNFNEVWSDQNQMIDKVLSEILKEELKANPMRAAGALLSKGAFKAVKNRISPERYSGAPLLGLNGHIFKAHGSSNRRAIRSAIFAASQIIEADMNHLAAADIELANQAMAQA